MKQCDFSKTVIAKRQEYIKQHCDEQGKLITSGEEKTKSFFMKVLRSLKSMSVCSHDNRRHKAKFMCHFCYLNKGNQQKATECQHKNRTHHSRGLCKSCYQKVYYKVVNDPEANAEHIQ
jgi:hypothetical protein